MSLVSFRGGCCSGAQYERLVNTRSRNGRNEQDARPPSFDAPLFHSLTPSLPLPFPHPINMRSSFANFSFPQILNNAKQQHCRKAFCSRARRAFAYWRLQDNRIVELVESKHRRGSWVPLASLHRGVEGNDQLYMPPLSCAIHYLDSSAP